MNDDVNRRDFLRNALLATSGLAAGISCAAPAAEGKPPAPPAAAAPLDAKDKLPTGRLAGLNVTRLILGGNLLTRYQHARDLGYVNKLVQSYNTDAKVRETIELAEARGINTLSVNITPGVLRILGDHRRNGGKIQTILYSTAKLEDTARFSDDLKQMTDSGTEAVYIWGEQADRCLREGKMELVRKALEESKLAGIPCGIGCHELKVVQEIEKSGWPVDFYIKTFHHHRYPSAPRAGEAQRSTSEVPGYWCRNPEETAAFMQTVAKPWIAFKVMAAGAIPPRDAFKYSFEQGADFVLAGMFDFDIAEDCQILRETVAQVQARARPWA